MSADHELSALLQQWSSGADAGPGFNRSVWARIEAAESRRAAALPLFSWIRNLATPRLAATCMVVSLFGGMLIGGLQARSSQEVRYLQSLQPLAAGMSRR